MMNIRIAGVAALLLLSACAMKQKVMDVAAVSMTKNYIPEGGTLKETGPVTGKYCADQWNDKGSIGLFDESVKAAQAQSGVDYILNASFWREGSCMTVEGTGAKVAGGAAPTMDAPAATPAAPAKKKR